MEAKNISPRNIVFALLLYAIMRSAFGAEVSVGRDINGFPIIDISGKIEKGDLNKIKKTSAKVILSSGEYNLNFHLNTPGGDIEEAMKIGQFAREILATVDSYGKTIIAPGSEDERLRFKPGGEPWKRLGYVVLRPDAQLSEEYIVRNYSAGILIFYGAVKRAHSDNSDQRLGFDKKRTIPVMGLHRPYYEKEYFSKLSPPQASEAYRKLENMVRNYLAEMGAPQSIIDRMFNRASNEIELLTADEFRGHYKSEESFLAEWLIARCGATTSYENALTGPELEEFPKIDREQIAARIADKTPYGEREALKIYSSKDFSQGYIETLYRKIRTYNANVHLCGRKAVSDHQREWAITYRE